MSRMNLTRRSFLKAAAGSVPAVLAGCSAELRRTAKRPNILWITCEDINPYLGCYGDPHARTPNIDQLASEGLLYNRAFATGPVCSPARSALVTGIYATSLGTQHLRSRVPIPPQIKTLPQLLRRAGYYCSNNYKTDYNFDDRGLWNESSHHAQWRNRPSSRPFFAVFNITCTHQGQINGSDEQFEAKYGWRLAGLGRTDPAKLSLPPYYPDTPFVRKIWARYYDLIAVMDRQLGRILAELAEDGLADDTIVFFFSDHGLGLPRHKRTLYDSGLHVPLIIRFGANFAHLAPAEPGTRIDRLVSFVDFAPTVLSLAGLEPPQYMQGRAFLGPYATRPRQYVFAAASRVDEAYETARAVRNERYKYIRNFMPHLPYIQPSEYPDRAEIMQHLRRLAAEDKLTDPAKSLFAVPRCAEELYDTRYDPYELHNLAESPEHQQILQTMRQQLHRHMIQIRDTGLLSEPQMLIRSAGSSPYQMAHDESRFDIERILAAAELVGKGPEKLAQLAMLCTDADPAVRYWAVIGLEAIGPEAVKADAQLRALLQDPSPDVRLAAAGLLARLGQIEPALPVLAAGLDDSRQAVVLFAARQIQLSEKTACHLVDKIRQRRSRCKDSKGNYRNDRHEMFIDWALKNALQQCSL